MGTSVRFESDIVEQATADAKSNALRLVWPLTCTRPVIAVAGYQAARAGGVEDVDPTRFALH